MISRRNIRVKTMQTLYVLAATEPGDPEAAKKKGAAILNDKLAHSADIFIISLLYTLRTAQYAEQDAIQRSSKYLPTAEDLKVSTKIAGNEFLWQILSEKSFQEKLKDSKLERFIDEEWIKKIYQQLVKTDEYKNYISENSRDATSERNIIRYIWERHILINEPLLEYFSEELPSWEDDADMTVMMMQNFFKEHEMKLNFLDLLSAEKKEFAHELMNTVIDKDEYCMSLIKPKLNSWEPERIAIIDILLLRMGLCELMYFPTIPTKVTINEYIEIAKNYSAPQSGQFINGVLDNILKDLEKDNKINKEERSRK
jgi:N utilization substance protein B